MPSRRKSTLDFVSGEAFDFGKTLPESPRGVMTRSRRTSIYGGSAAAPLRSLPMTTAPKSAKKVATRKPLLETVMEGRVKKKSPLPRAARGGRRSVAPNTKTAATATASAAKGTAKAKKITPPAKPARSSLAKDVKVVVERLENTPGIKASAVKPEAVERLMEEVKTSPKRVQIVFEEMADKMCTPPAAGGFGRRTTRSTRKKSTPHPNRATKKTFAPADSKSSPKSLAAGNASEQSKAIPFPGTPQMAEPTALLKLNLKNKVQEKMEEHVSKMPQTSPYTIMEGENESGSPGYMFTKLMDKPKATAKHLTSTPGLGNRVSSARRILGDLQQSNKPTPVRRRLSIKDFASPEDSDGDDENENRVLSPSPSKSFASSPSSPQPQLMTGDLGRLCAIM